jgi:AcrR family transcriptional regulator
MRNKADKSKAGGALSKERIVEAALALIDRDGLAAFSLRDVARALGVYPTALYWHVPGRNALLAAVVEHALRDIWRPRGRGSWQTWLRALFHRYRAAVRRHPNVAPLIGAQLVSNAGIGPELVERILATLAEAGFAGDTLVDAYNTVIASKVGFVTMELAAAPDEDRARWAAAMRARLDDIDPGKLPVLARNLPRLGNRAFILRWENGTTVPLDRSFKLYVEVFIAGLERMRARDPGRGRSRRAARRGTPA